MNRSLTLNKIVALGILVAFAMLLLELRFDHRNVLGEQWQSWLPLIYSGTMIVAGGVAVAAWERGGRTFLFWGFALALVVGSVGFWMHNEGEPQEGIKRVLSAWTQPISTIHEQHHEATTSDEHDHAASAENTDEASHHETDAHHETASPKATPNSASDEHHHAATESLHDETDAHHEAAAGHQEVALQDPPVLAPLSFAGLGLLGMLACARRFGPQTRIEQ